jgi:hypothetical protein
MEPTVDQDIRDNVDRQTEIAGPAEPVHCLAMVQGHVECTHRFKRLASDQHALCKPAGHRLASFLAALLGKFNLRAPKIFYVAETY